MDSIDRGSLIGPSRAKNWATTFGDMQDDVRPGPQGTKPQKPAPIPYHSRPQLIVYVGKALAVYNTELEACFSDGRKFDAEKRREFAKKFDDNLLKKIAQIMEKLMTERFKEGSSDKFTALIKKLVETLEEQKQATDRLQGMLIDALKRHAEAEKMAVICDIHERTDERDAYRAKAAESKSIVITTRQIAKKARIVLKEPKLNAITLRPRRRPHMRGEGAFIPAEGKASAAGSFNCHHKEHLAGKESPPPGYLPPEAFSSSSDTSDTDTSEPPAYCPPPGL